MEYSTETQKELKWMEAILQSQHEHLHHQHVIEEKQEQRFKLELDYKERSDKYNFWKTVVICATVFLTFALYFIAAYSGR